MRIIEVAEKGEWNNFVATNSSPSAFLQSWQWGEFQKALGHKIFRLAVTDQTGNFVAVILAVVRNLYLGKTYLDIAKGPVLKDGPQKTTALHLILKKLEELGSKEKAVIVRISRPSEEKLDLHPFVPYQPRILVHQIEPQDTILVDLSKSEEELLQNMHEKSRYNIRLAMKKGVKVSEKTADKAAFEKFLDLIEETSKRDGIIVWPRERFQKFREIFMINNPSQPPLTLRGGVPPLNLRGGEGELSPQAILLTGEYENQVLAAAIVMLFGDSGTYLYAASSAEQRNANVPSLVLWEAIRQSKLRGKKYYDMWGIAPAGVGEDHAWSGITRFKSRYIKIGVTGLEKHYTGTWDLVLDRKYYNLFRIGKIFKELFKQK